MPDALQLIDKCNEKGLRMIVFDPGAPFFCINTLTSRNSSQPMMTKQKLTKERKLHSIDGRFVSELGIEDI